jgi:hypothetical protein
MLTQAQSYSGSPLAPDPALYRFQARADRAAQTWSMRCGPIAAQVMTRWLRATANT